MVFPALSPTGYELDAAPVEVNDAALAPIVAGDRGRIGRLVTPTAGRSPAPDRMPAASSGPTLS